MQKSKMTIKWRAYKSDNHFKDILDYIYSLKGKDIYIKLDFDDYDGIYSSREFCY